jgi:hypothetical protein
LLLKLKINILDGKEELLRRVRATFEMHLAPNAGGIGAVAYIVVLGIQGISCTEKPHRPSIRLIRAIWFPCRCATSGSYPPNGDNPALCMSIYRLCREGAGQKAEQ